MNNAPNQAKPSGADDQGAQTVWQGDWTSDDEGLRELKPFVECVADGEFLGGYDFSYRGGESRRCYEPKLHLTVDTAREAARTAVQNWLRARIEREVVQETPVAAAVSTTVRPSASAKSQDVPPPSGGQRVVQDGELVTYWLYHNGELVGTKRMPHGTTPDAVRAAARDDATVTCDRLNGETPLMRESRIMNASIRVYDDRLAQERARRALPFELRGLFPKELPFFELTFRSDRGGVDREQHLLNLIVGLEELASRDAVDLAGLGELGWPYDHMIRMESTDTTALGQCEAAMKAYLVASGAVLVSEFGVGYVRCEPQLATEAASQSVDLKTRIDLLVASALSQLATDAVEAGCCAYEAGRLACGLDLVTPASLSAHPELVTEFERGRSDVPRDVADEERRDALAFVDCESQVAEEDETEAYRPSC